MPGFSTSHVIIAVFVSPELISASSSHVNITSGNNCAETGVTEYAIVAKISIVQTTLTTLSTTLRRNQLRIELLLIEY